jgi:hypothetical protein
MEGVTTMGSGFNGATGAPPPADGQEPKTPFDLVVNFLSRYLNRRLAISLAILGTAGLSAHQQILKLSGDIWSYLRPVPEIANGAIDLRKASLNQAAKPAHENPARGEWRTFEMRYGSGITFGATGNTAIRAFWLRGAVNFGSGRTTTQIRLFESSNESIQVKLTLDPKATHGDLLEIDAERVGAGGRVQSLMNAVTPIGRISGSRALPSDFIFIEICLNGDRLDVTAKLAQLLTERSFSNQNRFVEPYEFRDNRSIQVQYNVPGATLSGKGIDVYNLGGGENRVQIRNIYAFDPKSEKSTHDLVVVRKAVDVEGKVLIPVSVPFNPIPLFALVHIEAEVSEGLFRDLDIAAVDENGRFQLHVPVEGPQLSRYRLYAEVRTRYTFYTGACAIELNSAKPGSTPLVLWPAPPNSRTTLAFASPPADCKDRQIRVRPSPQLDSAVHRKSKLPALFGR